jgi:hypothetical protein
MKQKKQGQGALHSLTIWFWNGTKEETKRQSLLIQSVPTLGDSIQLQVFESMQPMQLGRTTYLLTQVQYSRSALKLKKSLKYCWRKEMLSTNPLPERTMNLSKQTLTSKRQ